MDRMTRKGFLKFCFAGLLGLFMGGAFTKVSKAEGGFNGRTKKPIKLDHDLVVVKGEDPYLNTVKAIEAIGGMDRVVKKGSIVTIKPNMGWDRTPEQAANTNPYVVEALVELCFKAGAKRVNIFDITCNEARRTYDKSGIIERALAKGANIYFTDEWNFINAKFPYQSPMEGWPIYRDALECDTFINVPILKHHGLTGLTLSMKNLMGVCGGNRGLIHDGIGLKLVHLTDFVNPDLTVIDAYRVLVRNGPTGGDLNDVELYKTVIVGLDPTLADAYAAQLVGYDPLSIPNILEAKNNNFGNFDISKADILKLEI